MVPESFKRQKSSSSSSSNSSSTSSDSEDDNHMFYASNEKQEKARQVCDAYDEYLAAEPLPPREETQTRNFVSLDWQENQDNASNLWKPIQNLKDDDTRRKFAREQVKNSFSRFNRLVYQKLKILNNAKI